MTTRREFMKILKLVAAVGLAAFVPQLALSNDGDDKPNIVYILADWTVGEVLKALESNGIRDKTMIVFAADNGVSKNFASSDQISPGFLAAKPLRGQKADIWEGGHRIPLIVEWKGRVQAGSTSYEYVELNDFQAMRSRRSKAT